MGTTGVVAVLDILGYKNFLENNEVGDEAVEVLKVLNNVEDKTTGIISFMFKKNQGIEKIKENLQKVRWLQFADTILLTGSYSDYESKFECWDSVCGVTRGLYSHLFAWGLPVRGAVTFGKFLIEKNCFVGSSINKAIQKAQELDLSAVALMKEAEEEYLQQGVITNEREIWEKNRYVFPLKENKTEKLVPLPPFVVNSLVLKGGGIRGSVISAFSDHNKSIGPTVINKINNTEVFFQWCLDFEQRYSKRWTVVRPITSKQ